MDKFNLKFQGEILPGHDPARVKRRFAREFYIDNPKRIEAFFSGQEIILRRNLLKDDAAKVFVALRKIGVITHIEKIEPIIEPPVEPLAKPTIEAAIKPTAEPPKAQPTRPPPAVEATPASATTPATSSPRRKKQAGAPNMFDLRLSDRANRPGDSIEPNRSLVNAPMIAAAIALLAFLLVGARFWSQSLPDTAAQGLGHLAIDPRQQPLIQAGGKLLLHDRAGISTDTLPLRDLGIDAALSFDYFGNGDLLLLSRGEHSALPAWLSDVLGLSKTQGNSLVRCQLNERRCTTLVNNLGPAVFEVDRRNDEIYLADPAGDMLQKLDASGNLLANKQIELSTPLHLRVQEGILYLTQAGSDAVLILKPDTRDFGMQLDQVALAVEGARQSGHIFPADMIFVNERWWVLMQSRDGSTAGLYQFTSRWAFERSIALPLNSLPDSLTEWATKVLVSDPRQELIYRFDAAAQQERDFSSEFLGAGLKERRSQMSLSQTLQAFILVILFGAAAGLMALGVLQSLRGKLYTHPEDSADAGFDINNDDILWLDPEPEQDRRMRLLGYTLVGASVLVLMVAFVAQVSTWGLVGIVLMLVGLGGLYLALQRSNSCHLGLLDDHLILVDHTNTWRVGSGPMIQYFKNYVMIDDVIVYLGNSVVTPFASEPLQQQFQPLFSTGIKVDRATLQVKLIQNRHPMLLGVVGLTCTVCLAGLLIGLGL